MYHAYILRSRKNNRNYIGSTENLERRVKEHNGELENPGVSTLSGRPWDLVFYAGYPSRVQALAAERYIKRMKSRTWIAKLIAGEYRLPEF